MAVTTMDVIDMNEALLTAQGLRGSTLTRESYGSDGEGEREWVPRRRLVEDRMTMSDSERTIFNKLGDSSSPKNKVRHRTFVHCIHRRSAFQYTCSITESTVVM